MSFDLLDGDLLVTIANYVERARDLSFFQSICTATHALELDPRWKVFCRADLPICRGAEDIPQASTWAPRYSSWRQAYRLYNKPWWWYRACVADIVHYSHLNFDAHYDWKVIYQAFEITPSEMDGERWRRTRDHTEYNIHDVWITILVRHETRGVVLSCHVLFPVFVYTMPLVWKEPQLPGGTEARHALLRDLAEGAVVTVDATRGHNTVRLFEETMRPGENAWSRWWSFGTCTQSLCLRLTWAPNLVPINNALHAFSHTQLFVHVEEFDHDDARETTLCRLADHMLDVRDSRENMRRATRR